METFMVGQVVEVFEDFIHCRQGFIFEGDGIQYIELFGVRVEKSEGIHEGLNYVLTCCIRSRF